MCQINYPLNLPKSKEHIYIKTINKGYIKTLRLINSLGGIITLDQLVRLYSSYNPNISIDGARKKIQRITKDMEEMNLIGSDKINTYKYFYMRRLASSFISGNYNRYRKITMTSILKHNKFTINLLRVEYFLIHKSILSTDNLIQQLLNITRKIYILKNENNRLPYNLGLIRQILADGNINNCKSQIELLPKDNLLRVIWIDLYNIFYYLKLQNQTISVNPFYFKLNVKDNKLTLHYVPEIIIYDVHDIKYYSKKIDELFYKFFNIESNNTRDMQKYYRINKTLGWDGYNHLAYVFKLVGTNKRQLLEKKNYIDSHIKENPNAILLSNCKIEHIDISKYFIHSSRNNTTVENIDLTFKHLLDEKLKSIEK